MGRIGMLIKNTHINIWYSMFLEGVWAEKWNGLNLIIRVTTVKITSEILTKWKFSQQST